MTAHCCLVCHQVPTCSEVLDAAFARPDDVTTAEPAPQEDR